MTKAPFAYQRAGSLIDKKWPGPAIQHKYPSWPEALRGIGRAQQAQQRSASGSILKAREFNCQLLSRFLKSSARDAAL